MESKPKNPKKVEQGKKLAALNRERREEWKKMKEELKKSEKEEEEEEVKEEHAAFKGNVFLPILALTVVGVGTFWYFRKSELRRPEVPKDDPRPKKFENLILNNFDKWMQRERT